MASAHTALLIVDMLKDFTTPEGLVYYPQNREILPRIGEVLEQCRKRDMVIVFLQQWIRAHKPDRKAAAMRPNCLEGTRGIEIDDALCVDPIRDYVIRKRRYSGFYGTDLDLVLREHGIKNVVIVGTKTNCCIRATVTDAFNLDYDPIVIRECVATNSETVNEVHLNDIASYLGRVMSAPEFFSLFDRGVL